MWLSPFCSANCSINNGGCHPNATCGVNVDGTPLCSCTPNFFGNGISCTARGDAEYQSLIARVR